ncbi:MAG: acyl carrier protein [Cognatishimia sp.]|uniref:acyl carrier protein n=1 Tax=Cognatishimia TaxID=2211635 RepID=UPI00223128A6|nr:acyl carrier protein [Cognatishimia activa]UZD90810.1 acyl carrier protein [Cognatishimia activa]
MPDTITQPALAEILADALADIVETSSGTRPATVNRDASLTSFGLDSLAMVNLVTLIEERLDIELEPELAFNYPTINALADFIGQMQRVPHAQE